VVFSVRCPNIEAPVATAAGEDGYRTTGTSSALTRAAD